MVEEDTLPVISPSMERSSHAPQSPSHNNPQGDDFNPKNWGIRAKKAKAAMARPKFLTICGAIVVTLGIILTVTAVTVTSSSEPSSNPSTSIDMDGIPLNASRPDDSSPDGIKECTVKLGDWNAYKTAALQAEQDLLGTAVTDISLDQLAAAVNATQPLLIGIVFWVPTSEMYAWSDTFRDDIETQTGFLNAAYSSANIKFRSHAILAFKASDDQIEQCDNLQSGLPLRLLRQLHDTDMLHVLLCEPQGVNGATPILGSVDDAGNGPALVVLRRSALWRSQTSLVHQIGHALGLAHPFPDSASCHYDADAVIDTPQQFRGSVDCEGDARGALCQGALNAGPAALPPFNYMDVSNDSCRQVFSNGQVMRMRSMMAAHRPTMYTSALQGFQLLPVPVSSGYQSALPSASLLRLQLEAVDAAHEGEDKEVITTAHAQALGQLSDPVQHGALAAGQSNSILSSTLTSLDVCSCAGADASGHVFWTAVLDGAYLLDAVAVTQPWEVFAEAPAPPPSPRTSDEDTEDYDAGNGYSASNAENIDVVLPDVQGVPTTDVIINVTDPAPVPRDVSLWDMVGAPLVDVRIGHSPSYELNARCTPEPVQLVSPLQVVHCNSTLEGRFVTAVLLKRQPQPDQEETEGQATQMCVCKVSPLSYVAPAQRVDPAPVSSLQGGLLVPPGSSIIVQSSTQVEGKAALATSTLSPAARSSASGGFGSSPAPSCSATKPEEAPWWSLRLGLDPWNVAGVRLMPSFVCPNPGPVGCGSASNITLDVYITNEPPSSSSSSNSNSNGVPSKGGGLGSSGVCASGIAVQYGQLIDIGCVKPVSGRVVTIIARNPAANSSQLQVLSLCEVQVIGSYEISLSEVMSPQLSWHKVQPPELASSLILPIDNTPDTCLTTSGNASLWQLALSELQVVHGVQITTGGAGGGGSSSSAVVSLLDVLGRSVWSATVPASLQGASGPATLMLPRPTAAGAVSVAKFTSLCDITLLGDGQDLVQSNDYMAASNIGTWQATAVQSIQDQSAAVVEVDLGAAIDGDRRTCAAVPAVEGSHTMLKLDMGTVHRIVGVYVTTDEAVGSVSVAIGQPSAASDSSDLWSSAVTCAPESISLSPWAEALFECPMEAVGSVVLVQGPQDISLRVCNLHIDGSSGMNQMTG